MFSQVDRRTLLRGAVVFSAGTALSRMLPGQSSFAKLPLSPVKLGIASYTFRNFDSARLIGFMHELRCPYLNLKDMHLPLTPLAEVPAKASAYRAAGFKLTAAGNISFSKDEDADIQSKFEYAKAAGIPVLVCAPTHQTLPRLEKFVKQYDIRLAIHNHGPEDKEFPSPLDVLKAVEQMDSRIGCCVDVGHCMRAGTDPVEAIRRVGPRLYDVHMKDLAQHNVKESQVAVGEGIMPVREIFQQLIRMKYAGFVDLEYEIKADDPLPGVMESFAYMRGVLRGLGYDTNEMNG